MCVEKNTRFAIIHPVLSEKVEGIDMQVQELYTEYDFEQLFSSNSFEEVHNQHSMTILGNSLEVLAQMKEKSVNLIFADAPYGIGKDFGNDSDKLETVEAYTTWCKQWLDKCMRVLKDDGTIYFMTATQHMPYFDDKQVSQG